jgi:hypothetical protein
MRVPTKSEGSGKHLVITVSDAHCGDFLARQWLASLEHVIDRGRVDVAVVDYGLTPAQRELLGSRGVLLWQGRRDGNVTVLRLRDIASFLACHRYDQVMVVDGGDVIFQDEFAEVFAMSPHSIRATCETYYGVEFWRLYLRGSFRRSLVPVIRDELRCRMAINTGMFIGPSAALQRCFSEAFRIIVNRWRWGADTVALNYVLYRNGFVPMKETYNYVPVTARRPFRIRQGRFYFRGGSLIKIVHNTGGRARYRIIGRLGKGAGRNRIRWFWRVFLYAFGRLCGLSRSLQAALSNRRGRGEHPDNDGTARKGGGCRFHSTRA